MEEIVLNITDKLIKHLLITFSICSDPHRNAIYQTFTGSNNSFLAMFPVVVVPPALTGSGLSTVSLVSWMHFFPPYFCLSLAVFLLHARTLLDSELVHAAASNLMPVTVHAKLHLQKTSSVYKKEMKHYHQITFSCSHLSENLKLG